MLSRWYACLKVVFCLLPAFTAVEAKTLMNIVIDGGQLRGLPIAIQPFSSHSALEESISAVVANDLRNSGQFEVKTLEGRTQDVSLLKKQGMETVLIGRLEKQSAENYTLFIELRDVFKAQDPKNLPLLSMRFDRLQSSQFRAIGHHVADLVFEKLIGIRGIFSNRIAYVSVLNEGQDSKGHPKRRYTLQIADADGHNPQVLYQSNFPLLSPAWSPDAKRLAFVSFENHRAQIYVADLLTGKLDKVSAFSGINGAPAFSPDGRKLALVLSKSGSPKIYSLDLQDRSLTQLTTGVGIDTEPYWHPNGQALIFTSNRGGRPQIYQLDIASKKVNRLTFKGVYNARPSMTQDGQKLVMMHQVDKGAPFGIAIQDLKTGQLRLLTQANLDDSPSVAPNGMMILYGSQRAGRHILAAVSVDGKLKLQLPAHEGDVQEPAWSPFTF